VRSWLPRARDPVILPRVTTANSHEALHVPLADRVDYLMILASMAGADVVLAKEELEKLRQLCAALELPPKETADVLTAAHRPTASIARHLDQLKGSPLRFALLSDCLALAYADGDYAKSERKEIVALARALEVDEAQFAALEECAAALQKATAEDGSPAQWSKRGEELASQLAAVGIPLGAVATLSAVGLASAGVSTGVAALVVGLGIASGFGAALGLGVGTVLGLRWLYGKLHVPG
jgi:uncharacterized tellurite resistance protein B-like protein